MAKSHSAQITAKNQAPATEVISDAGHRARNSTSLFPLRHVAESIGAETMVMLASLSRDDRVRAVAERWTLLSRKAKQTIEFEQLCRAVHIDGGHFFSVITGTAFELGMDVSGFIGSVQATSPQLPTSAKDTALREHFFRAAAFWAGATSMPVCELAPLARAPGRRG
jgi:hypothetical protein